MVEEFNAQYLNRVQVFEGAHIDVLAFSDIQKYTVDKKQEGFDVQVLAP